ncbi:MAG TPA: NAD-dependent epimerase/dehydratase family protein [Polyangiaceae bacterium]|nr:NAD-dependent epimerase/dehydratase family protein [Polyangiaceae bacterium]
MRVAVTGGGGRLGNVLVRALLDAGHRVKVLELGDDCPASLAGLDIALVRGSVLDRTAVDELVRDADVVYHLAAKVDLDRDRDGSIHTVNVEGTRRIAEACLSRELRMVHCSSHHALVLEPLDQPLDESKPLALEEPCDYHRAKAHAEQLVLDLARGPGLDAVIVSPGSLIGPHDYEPSILGRALLDLYHRRIPILLEAVSDYVDARDVAQGVVAAAERGRRGERYLLTGPVLDIGEMTSIWHELTGVPMPRAVLPLWVGWAMLPLTLAAARLSGRRALFTPGMLRASVSNRVVSHAKAARELGYAPRSVRDSLRDALGFYRDRGWLAPGARLSAA